MPPTVSPDVASMACLTPRELYETYASSIIYVAVERPDGSQAIGSAFHVGEGVFLTARHVVDGCKILEVANTVSRHVPDPVGKTTFADGDGTTYRFVPAAKGEVSKGPFFHPVDSIDVAALVVSGIECPAIPLGGHLDDWLNDDAFALAQVVVFGYPPVPQVGEPKLISSRGEVNAVIDKYTGGHPHFLVSTIARGGFSGGPCVVEWNFALGMVTESLVHGDAAPEMGFAAMLSVEPLWECLAHNSLVPAAQKEGWDGLWDRPPSEIGWDRQD